MTLVLRRAILLAGGPHPSAIMRACGLALFSLPVTPNGRSVLDLWTAGVASHPAEVHAHSDRVLCVSATPDLASVGRHEFGGWSLRADASSYRGPAGVVRDATLDLNPDDHVLVGEASRAVGDCIVELLRTHADTGADATIGVNPDHSPAGVLVLRRRVLECVPDVGYMDIKEQFLPKVVSLGFNVRAAILPAPGAIGFRTRLDLLAAANLRERSSPGPPEHVARLARISPTAMVHEGAHIVESIIGPAARVEDGAVVVRSIVTGSAVVTAGTAIHDAIVTSGGIVHDLE